MQLLGVVGKPLRFPHLKSLYKNNQQGDIMKKGSRVEFVMSGKMNTGLFLKVEVTESP